MEYYMVARALKSSFQKELPLLAMKTSAAQQYLLEDNIMYNNSNVEDFSVVDCFFDFSNNTAGEFKESNINTNLSSSSFNKGNNIQEPHDHEEEEEKDSDHDNNSNISTTFDDSFLSGGLSVPSDDLAELEWVSHFVDDTSSEFSLYPVKSENFHARNHFQPEQPKPVVVTKPSSCLFPVKIPAKPRSKRTRPTARKWSVESILTDSSNSCSYSSSSSSPVSSSGSTPWLFTVLPIDLDYAEPPMKKPKKKPAFQTGGIMGPNQFQRRCSHCQVQKTPQWRTGPLGAKTLCNACGVRFKSGRLFPEYRPACSPTFSSEIHSNSHRKVLEIRKKKEVEPTSELSRMVPSF